MPYEYVDAELLLEHRGVKVYHIYKKDMVDEGKCGFWFGLSPWCHEGDRDMFDVRDLARQLNMSGPNNKLDIVITIIQAIERGLLTKVA